MGPSINRNSPGAKGELSASGIHAPAPDHNPDPVNDDRHSKDHEHDHDQEQE
jgi:hypothetical protein